MDELAAFTVGSGSNAATFWSAMAISSIALARRTPDECAGRVAAIDSPTIYGPQPPVLEAWERLDGGRIIGMIDGRAVWLTIALEGRLASDPRSDSGYIEAVGGRVLELGERRVTPPAVKVDEMVSLLLSDSSAESAEPIEDSAPSRLANQLRINLLATVCFFGFFLGANGLGNGLGTPVAEAPPPPPQRLFIAQPRSDAQAASQLTAQQQQQQQGPVRLSLTIQELIARQKLRVEGDRVELSALEPSEAARRVALDRLRADDAKLGELQALQASFGATGGMKFAATMYDAGLEAAAQEANASPTQWIDGSPGPSKLLALTEPYATLGANTLDEQVTKQVARTENLARTLAQVGRLESARAAAGAEAATPPPAPGAPNVRRAQLELSLKWAEQNLRELQRAEALRGGQSAPVVLGQWVQVQSVPSLFPSP